MTNNNQATGATPLRVLFVDDCASDVLLLNQLLLRAGFAVTYDHFEAVTQCETAVLKDYDVIISDFHLIGSTAFDVLRILRAQQCDTPVIVVSGVSGEEAAVDVIKAGAADYVLKNNPRRLMAAIERERQEAKRRRKQREAEEALRRNEELLRAVLENLPVGVWVTDKEGTIVSCNAAAIKIWGEARYVGVDEYKQYKARWAKTGDAVRADEWAPLQVLRTGKPFVNEDMEIEPFTGDPKIIVNSAVPMFDSSGEVMGTVIVNEDITQKRRALEQLQSSRERFFKIFCSCPIGICISHLDTGKIIDVNDAFLQATGYSKEESVDRRFAELNLWENSEQETLLKIEIQKARGAAVKNLEVEFRKRNGDLGHVLLSLEIVSLESGLCLLTFFDDISARKSLETQFLRAQKLQSIGQLAGGVAHDFNNLLTVIQGHSAIIQMAEDLNPNIADGLGEINKSAERAAHLTRQLLAFGRKQVLKAEVADLNVIVESVARMLRRVVGEHVDILLHCFPNLPSTLVDIGMVEQVLMNLAINARDAMPTGGTLTISTERVTFLASDQANNLDVHPGDYVCLSVADTGSGIPVEIIGQIFEPFFTTKENGKGSGLGLASVYGIMKQHGGWVSVQSQLGLGTRFEAYFPVSYEKPVERETRTAPVNLSGSETILIAEDDEGVRDLAALFLKRRGYKVFQTDSGAHALEWRQTSHEKIDLLLTDIIMPGGVNGLELAANLRVHDPSLKVIFSSGYSSDISGLDLSQLDRMRFLRKPYQPDELCRVIRACLDEP